jgi:predicted glycosyltransferase
MERSTGAQAAPVWEKSASAKKFVGRVAPENRKKIWIDIDNSPHVPFFLPIIEELEERGHQILLTARDLYQVCELLEFHHLRCTVIGKHWGKHRMLKMLGTLGRAARLVPLAVSEKPDLAVSLVSRSQILVAKALQIPIIVTFDYEFVEKMQFLQPDWIVVPDVLPNSGTSFAKEAVFRYPGLKEDVYVPRFVPDPALKQQLGIGEGDLVVTVRPPATEAHYHNPESEQLMTGALNYLMAQPHARVVLVPRNTRQSEALRSEWAYYVAVGKIVIPEHVVDGLNLIWHSDLVISGGGTMNREAAALGVPVYSIFRGRIGAVDRELEKRGRLVLIENVDEIRTKIILKRREQAPAGGLKTSAVLRSISDTIISIAECQCQ